MNTETMNSEFLWRRMQKDWQVAEPTVDASALVRQISRRRRFMRVCVAVDVVGTVAITGQFAYMMFTHQGGTAPLAILMVFGWIVLAIGLWSRRGTWRAQGTDTRALLKLVERRARYGIRRSWRTAIGVWVPFVLVSPWQWQLWVHQVQTRNAWLLVPAIVIACGEIWAFWYRRRQRRKLQRARALLEQLSREDESL